MCNCKNCTVRCHGGLCAYFDAKRRRCALEQVIMRSKPIAVLPSPEQKPELPFIPFFWFEDTVHILTHIHPRLCDPEGVAFVA